MRSARKRARGCSRRRWRERDGAWPRRTQEDQRVQISHNGRSLSDRCVLQDGTNEVAYQPLLQSTPAMPAFAAYEPPMRGELERSASVDLDVEGVEHRHL